MKYIFPALLIFYSSAKPIKDELSKEQKVRMEHRFFSTKFNFSETKMVRDSAVESEFFTWKYQKFEAYDDGMNGDVTVYSEEERAYKLPFKARFPYFVPQDTSVLIFYVRENKVYSRETYDFKFYGPEKRLYVNQKEENIWNPVVVRADKFVIFAAEMGDGNSPEIRFFSKQPGEHPYEPLQEFTLKGSGNPDCKYIENHGLICFHGIRVEGIWKTAVSTIRFREKEWKTRVLIDAGQVHACDPAVRQEDGHIVMNFSWNQQQIWQTKISGKYEDFF